MQITSVIFSVISCLAAFVAIVAFVQNSKKDINKTASHNAETTTLLRSDLQYVKNGLDEMRVDLREIMRGQSELKEKVARFDERFASLEQRVDRLEHDWSKLE